MLVFGLQLKKVYCSEEKIVFKTRVCQVYEDEPGIRTEKLMTRILTEEEIESLGIEGLVGDKPGQERTWS